jgi:hypothetical protein
MNFNTNQSIGATSNSSGVISSSARFVSSSKKNPCPICGRVKDGDCRSMEAGNVVLCHTFKDAAADINGYRYIRASDRGAGWGVWAWAEEKGNKKYTRPDHFEAQKVYDYLGRDGKPLIRVHRQKGREPEFYQSYYVNGEWLTPKRMDEQTKAEMRKAVPLYRYAEIRQAIERGDPIVWVEGEKCADALWRLGIAATTSIGGSGALNYWGDYSRDLDGAALVVMMPDRDQVGIKYLEAVQKTQNINGWIKCFPKSPIWDLCLPKEHGLDVADWIAEGARKADILALIDAVKVDGGTADQKGRRGVSSAETLAASGFAKKGGKVDTFHDIRESQEEIKILEGKLKARLDLSVALPKELSELADSLKQVARSMPTAPEALLTSLLAVCASLIGTSSSFAIPARRWIEPTVIWSMIVAESGKLKTPTQKTLIDPLKKLQKEATREYKRAHKQWEQDKKAHESNKDNKGESFDFEEPTKREYYLSDSTLEALGQVHAENPRGFLRFQDEIDGFYAQQNKYRAGAGDDEQTWLSINSGEGFKVNRMTRKFELFSTAISMTGSIQPETLAKHNNESRNGSGMNSRWLYCMVTMPDRFPTGEVIPAAIEHLLMDVYRKLALVPCNVEEIKDFEGNTIATEQTPRLYTMTEDAMRIWLRDWEVPMITREGKEPNKGMQKILNKYAGFCGRIACVLHLLQYVMSLPKFEECEGRGLQISPPPQIEASTIKSAIVITSWFVKQAEIMYGVSTADDEDMTPAMIRLKEISLKLASDEKAQGWLSPKLAKQQTRLIKSADHAKALFAEMYESGFGELDTSGRTPKWRYVETENESSDSASTRLLNPENIDIERLVQVYTQGGTPRSPESTVYQNPAPQENPFNNPKPEIDPSYYFSDEVTVGLRELVQDAIDSETPEIIDSLFSDIPADLRADVKELVLSFVVYPDPSPVEPESEATEEQSAEQTAEQTVEQQAIDLNKPAQTFTTEIENVFDGDVFTTVDPSQSTVIN